MRHVVTLAFVILIFSAIASAQGTGQTDPAHSAPAADTGENFFTNFFKVYMPRQMCMFYESSVIWLHVISDFLIAVAYFSIPFALVYFVRRRRDVAFGGVFWMFAAFILACGTTHAFGVVDIWRPFYRVDGVVKAITAGLSIATAIALWKLMPAMLAIPSAAQLENSVRERTAALAKANHDLRIEMHERMKELTARKEVESALHESEERFKLLANTIPQLAWMARPDGHLFWYNRRWHDYCGTTPESMEGWGWTSVHDPAELPRVIEKWKAHLASGEPWEDIFPLRRHDGQFRAQLSRAMPMRNSEGKIVVWFGTNTDIEEQRQMANDRNEALERERAAREEAERIGHLKDEFLATLSHELRTPLTAILGWSQLLKRQHRDDPKLNEGLAVIERNSRMQSQLIEDLLDMSRIISGKMRIDVQSVNLVDVVTASIESVQPAADAKEIRIERILDSHAAPVRGDANRLQQVLWNILNNAIKFTPRGGRVQVSLQRINSHVEISVTDNGDGISAEFLPHVFEQFRQADGSITRTHGGLGLGLAIVKNLVELHGGRVKARSGGTGHGSTFTVELPVMIVHAPAETDGREHPARAETLTTPDFVHDTQALSGVTVLAIDDEEDARILIARVLSECQAIVFTAGSAAEGLQLLKQRRPDVILSDIGMPGEDGYEFIRHVRQLPDNQGGNTPAAALTAFVRSEDRMRALRAGYQTHLAKPVEPAELVTVVASLAGKIRSQQK